MYVKHIDNDIDTDRLQKELDNLLAEHSLESNTQISVTSIMGDDDWTCSIGRDQLKFKERFYSTINKSLEGTYLHSMLTRYSQYYRWRILKLSPKTTYSVHNDFNGRDDNLRLHIPIKTNEESFLCFFNDVPTSGSKIDVTFEHLLLGNSYEVNTTGWHTAVNYGTTDRFHLVGIRNAPSNTAT